VEVRVAPFGELSAFAQNAYPWTIPVALALSFVDMLTTLRIYETLGAAREGNPLYRFALRRLGPPGLWLAWIAYWAVVLAIFGRSSLLMLVFVAAVTVTILNNALILWRGRAGPV